MAYWDTSCLLKLYAAEPDSVALQSHLLAETTTVTSMITRFELWGALRRKESLGDLRRSAARTALAAYDADVASRLIQIAPLDTMVLAKFELTIEQCYSRSIPIALRTLDAIHVATALISGETEVVATDSRLREAARFLGLNVYPPP